MTKPLTSLVLSTLLLSTAASAELVGEHFIAELDIPYGKGLVTVDGNITQRDLLMDVVKPAEPRADQNPVVVMTFGGNFIRGGRNDVYSVEGAQTTTMRDYCKLFAKEGYTCVAIDYRLSLEEPVPSNIGYSDELLVEDELRMKRFMTATTCFGRGRGSNLYRMVARLFAIPLFQRQKIFIVLWSICRPMPISTVLIQSASLSVVFLLGQ